MGQGATISYLGKIQILDVAPRPIGKGVKSQNLGVGVLERFSADPVSRRGACVGVLLDERPESKEIAV